MDATALVKMQDATPARRRGAGAGRTPSDREDDRDLGHRPVPEGAQVETVPGCPATVLLHVCLLCP